MDKLAAHSEDATTIGFLNVNPATCTVISGIFSIYTDPQLKNPKSQRIYPNYLRITTNCFFVLNGGGGKCKNELFIPVDFKMSGVSGPLKIWGCN
jgi:hypothetical protein